MEIDAPLTLKTIIGMLILVNISGIFLTIGYCCMLYRESTMNTKFDMNCFLLLIRFLQTAEMLKPSTPSASHDSGGSSGPDDGSEYYPHLSKPSSTKLTSVLALCDLTFGSEITAVISKFPLVCLLTINLYCLA